MKSKIGSSFPALTFAVLALTITGCATLQPSDQSADEFVTIDVQTLEVQNEHGTTVGERVPNAFVGEVTEELLIGVATPEESGARFNAGDIIVYLCDSETVAAWFSTRFTGNEMTIDFGDIAVELIISDDEVTGTATIADSDPMPFTARRAGQNSGLFTAEGTFDGVTYRGGWIVLEDGRQAGWYNSWWYSMS